jgi:hypothetical protein
MDPLVGQGPLESGSRSDAGGGEGVGMVGQGLGDGRDPHSAGPEVLKNTVEGGLDAHAVRTLKVRELENLDPRFEPALLGDVV